MTPGATPPSGDIPELLRAIVGGGHVLSDDAACIFYAQDVYTRDLPALAVVFPADTRELAAVVKSSTERGCAVIARGGGMSYTSGLVPQSEHTVMIDLSRLDRVLEINAEDMYVTVQPGCSWEKLHRALSAKGLRTPCWGTLSGRYATVGGGASQNSIFWGSGKYGTAADSIVSLELVLADGCVINTGAAVRAGNTPFFRHFGPDLTGLFLCDSGALGIKSAISLRLVAELPGRACVSFDFPGDIETIAAAGEVARRGLAMEAFGFDPNLQRQRLKRESMMADIKALGGVIKSQASLLNAVKEGVKVALSGRRYMKQVEYSMHFMVEESTAAGAGAAAAAIRQICGAAGGREIEASIPKIARANPFGPVNNMIGPQGERWLPVHGIFPHSKAPQAAAAITALFEANSEVIAQHGILIGYLYTLVSSNAFVIEPVFFWPDELNELHRASIEADYLKRISEFPANPEARAVVDRLRSELIAVMDEHGAAHMQVGKSYPFFDTLPARTQALLKALKAEVDPQGLMNPGTLGL